jgi:hypothetical protein
VAGPFMPAWCLICAALLACLSPAQPTKSLDLSLTLTNNVIHVNDVPEHLLTMYPVCTLPRVRRCPFGSRSMLIPGFWCACSSSMDVQCRTWCQVSHRTPFLISRLLEFLNSFR